MVVTWLIALLACLAIISSGWIARTIIPPADPPFPGPDPGIVLMTRVAMGMQEMGLPATTGFDLRAIERELTPLDELRDAPESRQRTGDLAAHLRLAIILAEFGDADAARGTIETIASFDELPEPIAEDVATLHRFYIVGDRDTPFESGFRERHGWFAELAATYQIDRADSAERAAILDDAVRRVVALFVFGGGFIIASLAALVLFIIAIVLLFGRQIRMRHRIPSDEPGIVNIAALETFTLFVVAFAIIKFASSLLENANLSEGTLALAGIALLGAQWALALLVLWPLLRGVPLRHYTNALGVPRLLHIPREIFAGIAGYFALLPIVVLGFFITLGLTAIFDAQPSHPIQDEMAAGADPLMWLLIFSLAVIWAPFVEEAIFRGFLYHHCRRFVGIILSALVTGFLFAAIHPQGWTFVPVLMALGINFAILRAWRGTLVAPITAHALHNGAILTLAFFLIA
ncbi:MAG: CPBP family intramembrane metalloprotease [Phycisphaeraceae bacterium]|nr:MAG: CPBP family intramembrane metalloprotease [Phycisphaeraceae bacterium]